MDVNSREMNLLVTLLVAVLVFLLPWADRRICRRLRLNLEGGLSENPDADRLLRLRQRLLVFGFLLYLLLFAWLVFFSRNASTGFTVHVAPLEDVKNAFSTPTGFSGWFPDLSRPAGGSFPVLSQCDALYPHGVPDTLCVPLVPRQGTYTACALLPVAQPAGGKPAAGHPARDV